jgi:hypothetical protein
MKELLKEKRDAYLLSIERSAETREL